MTPLRALSLALSLALAAACGAAEASVSTQLLTGRGEAFVAAGHAPRFVESVRRELDVHGAFAAHHVRVLNDGKLVFVLAYSSSQVRIRA